MAHSRANFDHIMTSRCFHKLNLDKSCRLQSEAHYSVSSAVDSLDDGPVLCSWQEVLLLGRTFSLWAFPEAVVVAREESVAFPQRVERVFPWFSGVSTPFVDDLFLALKNRVGWAPHDASSFSA